MPRKGRARRFREARELKQGFDDGLFAEGSGSLADVADKDLDEETVADEKDKDEEDPYAEEARAAEDGWGGDDRGTDRER